MSGHFGTTNYGLSCQTGQAGGENRTSLSQPLASTAGDRGLDRDPGRRISDLSADLRAAGPPRRDRWGGGARRDRRRPDRDDADGRARTYSPVSQSLVGDAGPRA